MIRYYGLYSNAHRGKKRKADSVFSPSPIIEEESLFVPSKGWAEMIRKVYEVDPLLCSAFLVIDLVVLSVIILIQYVRGWKLGKIVKDLMQVQKGNSYLFITKRYSYFSESTGLAKAAFTT